MIKRLTGFSLILVINSLVFFFEPQMDLASIALIPGMTPWWTYITHMFIHANFAHYFYNMFFTAPFAIYYESKVGPKRFVMDWIICGLLAAKFFTMMPSLSLGDVLLGASGACSGIMALALLHFRKDPSYGFYAMGALLGLLMVNLVPGIIDCFIPSGIAHMAHVGGLLTGVAIYFLRSLKREEIATK